MSCLDAPRVMMSDRLQRQRFELKYLVSEERATALRQFLRGYLRPDEFAATWPGHAYPVHSVYLDSADLRTYQAVQAGEKNRFKLRVRYYSEQDPCVFFEIKRRTNEAIEKLRARVRRESVQHLLDSAVPASRHLVRPDARELAGLREFCGLVRSLRAAPKSHVGYMREAWMSVGNNSLRATFDRQVQCEPDFECALGTGFTAAVQPFGDRVVFELKFIDRLPDWCSGMVRTFDLVRSGAPKYAQGVLTLGEHRVRQSIGRATRTIAGGSPLDSAVATQARKGNPPDGLSASSRSK